MKSNLYLNNDIHYKRKVVFYGLMFIIILFVIMSLRISVSYHSGDNIQIDPSNTTNIESDTIESNDTIAILFSSEKNTLAQARNIFNKTFEISDKKLNSYKLIY